MLAVTIKSPACDLIIMGTAERLCIILKCFLQVVQNTAHMYCGFKTGCYQASCRIPFFIVLVKKQAWGLGWEMSPHGPCVWAVGPHWAVPSGKVV